MHSKTHDISMMCTVWLCYIEHIAQTLKHDVYFPFYNFYAWFNWAFDFCKSTILKKHFTTKIYIMYLVSSDYIGSLDQTTSFSFRIAILLILIWPYDLFYIHRVMNMSALTQ